MQSLKLLTYTAFHLATADKHFFFLFTSGCDPDPAREAVNQMHRAFLPHVGAKDGRVWKQAASPA